MKRLLTVATIIFLITCSAVADEILLGRPTDDSITVNVIPDQTGEISFEYGTTSTTSGDYDANTSAVPCTLDEPNEVVIGGLSADTLYYYRLRFRATSEDPWTSGDEYSFRTQRAPGSTFTFTITSDSHVNILMGIASVWTQTLNNVAADNPEFHIDLGDTVAMRSVTPGDVAGAEAAYEYQRTTFFNIISSSAPIFLAPGNHEQDEGWHLLSPLEDSLPVIGTNAMKKYFVNPVPDDFYSGDANTHSYLDGDQLREDYYSWTWGDALFVVIDPFWFSTTRPYVSDPGGGETDATGSGDSWDWTLGQEQYNWLKTTLETSNAKYKFVFSHQMTADASLSYQEDYGHGGANHSHFVEWGGYNEDGTTWGWDTERPGWDEPIHQMMVANGVSAFFHGHDHQYAYEKRDGVVYQAVPVSGWGNGGSGFNMYTTGSGYTIQALPNAGHLRVTVEPSQATVDYVQTSGVPEDGSYTIEPRWVISWVISGYILESDLTPIEGVLVDANNTGGSDITDVNGYYETSVPNDWSGTVTPTKTNYTFTPTSRSYTNVIADIPDQNYTGTESVPSVPIVLLDDGFEGAVWDANWVSPHNWLKDTGTYASGTASAHADKTNYGDFNCIPLDTNDAVTIYVDFWLQKNNISSYTAKFYYYNGTTYDEVNDIDALGADDEWIHYTDTITDSNYFIPDFRIQFSASLSGGGPGRDIWVDDVVITKEIEGEITCDAANLDGIDPVNFKDVAILANDWRLTGSGLAGDIDGNDIVNFDDLDWMFDCWLND